MDERLFISHPFTPMHSFTAGIEGPACDQDGNLYAVNFARQHTIGQVMPDGTASTFIELADGSIGNGIRFNRAGDMLIADYVNHTILRVDMTTRQISVFAHEKAMNQPNDIAITANDVVFASDPNWDESTGQLWRVDTDGTITLLEAEMGTTNGIEVSSDERTLYVNESVQRNIWAYDLSPEGAISNKRLLIQFPDYGMDGMRCDIAGRLFVTRYDKGVVAVVLPDGQVEREIRLLGKKCSNIAFGGPDGSTCYVTLADHGNVEVFRTNVPGRSWQLAQRDT